MGPYAGVDYNLTLRPLQSRLQHNYHGHFFGQPYARVDLKPMPESTLSPSQGRWPQYSTVELRDKISLHFTGELKKPTFQRQCISIT